MNYYYVYIKSDKITQKLAAQIFNEIASQGRVRSFKFIEAGMISYNSRGLADIGKLLEDAGVKDEEIKIQDEFERVYEYLDKEEKEKINAE